MKRRVRVRAALHEVRCLECRVTWLSWAQRALGLEAGFVPRPPWRERWLR